MLTIMFMLALGFASDIAQNISTWPVLATIFLIRLGRADELNSAEVSSAEVS
jgi:hypothetical protein